LNKYGAVEVDLDFSDDESGEKTPYYAPSDDSSASSLGSRDVTPAVIGAKLSSTVQQVAEPAPPSLKEMKSMSTM
jgi:hypothetical protein